MSDAFKVELLRAIPRMRGYAMSLARSAPEADDLVQDALMKAWRARDRFALGTNMQAWLFRILRNTFYNSVVAARHTVQDVDGLAAARLASQPEQEWSVRYGELLDALDRLQPNAREALLLVVGAGLSYEDAAMVCGCPVGTMKSRVKRARELLAGMVAFEGAERSRMEAAGPVEADRWAV